MVPTEEVLPAPGGRWCDRPHGVDDPTVGVGPERLELRLQPDPLLGGHGARQVGVVLVLVHQLQAGRRVLDGRVAAQQLGPPHEEHGLLRGRHAERVDLVRRHPRDVRVHGLGSQLDGCGGHRRRHAGDPDRRLCQAHRLVHVDHDARREPPRAVGDDAHRHPAVGVVARALEGSVACLQVLVADPLEPEVGMAHPQLRRPP